MKNIIKRITGVCLGVGTAATICNSAEVMTWVPWYGLDGSKTVLDATYGENAVKDVITRVGLQFWNLKTDGSVELFAKYDENDEFQYGVKHEDVQYFVDWAKDKDVKILLTLINNGEEEFGYNSFDWRLTRAACYGETGDTTIKNILKIVDSLDLDGVDLDVEGEMGAGGPFTDDDKDKYAVFVNKLADSIHSRSKIITLDMYPTNGAGVPNPSWVSSWNNKLDAIHGMGYFHDYWSAPGEKAYQKQQDMNIAAGLDPDKYMIGMPMWLNAWKGDQSGNGVSNVENLSYVLNCMTHQTGVTLWDIHHPSISQTTNDVPEAHPWTADTVWSLLKDIKDGKAADPSVCPTLEINEKIIDDMSNKGANLKGGLWSASSDFWSRKDDDRKNNSTKVWNIDMDHDIVAENGTWGDIGKGYLYLNNNGDMIIQSVIQAYTKMGTQPAYGGFVMNFLPIDPTLDPEAQTWEIAKLGVEQDLSAYDSLVVGMRCEVGKQVRMTLSSKAIISDYSAGAYGKYFDCTGEYEDYALEFAKLEAVWGERPVGFDASKSLRLAIDWVAEEPPGTFLIEIAGVAVDTSVVGFRDLSISPDWDESLQKIAENVKRQQASVYHKTENFSWNLQVDSHGFNINPQASGHFNLVNINGESLELGQYQNGKYQWKNQLKNGVYFLKINNSEQSTIRKITISP